MKQVKIIKNWTEPDLLRQTPGGNGIWDDVQFTFAPKQECDYLIVLNYIPNDYSTIKRPQQVWAFIQEPYIPGKFDWVTEGHEQFSKVFTHYIFNQSEKYIGTQTCLPWHVNKTYDQLISTAIPKKTKNLSWITSNKKSFPGHKARMKFYDNICDNKEIDIDIYGYGINAIEDKWDGLVPYKYSLAIENSSGEHYWTEKIADCFLSYCLPIYYGCTNLNEYFPEDSFIQIDIKDVDTCISIINRTINSTQWEKRLDAIIEARELVLHKHQLFPFVVNQINQTFQCPE